MPTLTMPGSRQELRPPVVEVRLDEAIDRAREAVASGLEAGAALAAALPKPADMARHLPADQARELRDSAGDSAKDVGRAVRDRARDALAGVDAEAMSSKVKDRLPQRQGPSPLPFVLGGLLIGLTVGYWLATSSMVAPRLRSALDRARASLGGPDDGADDLDLIVERFETADVMGARPAAGLGDYQLETSHPDEQPFPTV
ncbi:MAG TPA: hypothetical protein VF763_03160 [Candidatus Limnocylindrales bacterium]